MADVLRDHASALRLSDVERRAVAHILACRTGQLGGHLAVCDHCGASHFAYHSCRDRHCPRCGSLDQARDPRHRYRTTRGVGATGLQAVRFLRASGALPPAAPTARPDRARQIESEYTVYLREERGVAEATVAVYLRMVHPFVVEYLGGGSSRPGKLDAAAVVRFVLRHASRESPRYAKLRVTALRSFLRFTYVQGRTGRDLGVAVPTVPNWRLASLPRFISATDVLRLVRSCDCRAHGGRRDYAILLLLARLGLRATEVAHLKLEDIDWDVGELIVHGKGQRQDRLPLPPDVGQALADYICHDRPRCKSRTVFVRLQAPLDGLGGMGIASIVKRAIERVGLPTPSGGAHLLRHLVRRGSSIPEIAELLRHRSPETTMLYAKVDLTALRRVAPPWPA